MTTGLVKAPILVLGVGNVLLGDDGAGLLLFSGLARPKDVSGRAVEFLDEGTQGLALLDRIAGAAQHRHVTEQASGTAQRFHFSMVHS